MVIVIRPIPVTYLSQLSAALCAFYCDTGCKGYRCWTRWHRRVRVLLMSAPWYPRSRSAPGPRITDARLMEREASPPTMGQSLVGHHGWVRHAVDQ